MKTRILLGGALLLAALAAAQEPETHAVVAAEVDSAAGGPHCGAAETGSDPFRFGYQGGTSTMDQSLIPVDVSQLAIGKVHVRGILILEDESPCALVQVEGNKQVQLVREKDLILMPTPSRRRAAADQVAEAGRTYLLVTKIQNDSILVAPKKSPDAAITIR